MSVIVLTGGGTAGHCTPNIALIPYLKKDFDEIYYIGGENGMEKRLAEKAGLKYYSVPSAKLERKLTFKNLSIPFKVLQGVSAAKKILGKLSPDVVFSKGGYVALPVVIAAAKLKIPVVSHESDLSLGLANKIAARYSRVVLTSFKKTAENLKNGKYVGTPVRRELFGLSGKAEILGKYGLSAEKKTLLATGGSQGAAKINSLVRTSLPRLLKKYNVILLCGKGKKSGEKAENFVEIEFSDDVGELMRAADVCVSRAGANTLFELIALGVPTLAVPLPKGNSRGDQIENAEYLAGKGFIEILREEDATEEEFLKKIEKLMANGERFRKKCLAANVRGGAEKIAAEIRKIRENDRK